MSILFFYYERALRIMRMWTMIYRMENVDTSLLLKGFFDLGEALP